MSFSALTSSIGPFFSLSYFALFAFIADSLEMPKRFSVNLLEFLPFDSVPRASVPCDTSVSPRDLIDSLPLAPRDSRPSSVSPASLWLSKFAAFLVAKCYFGACISLVSCWIGLVTLAWSLDSKKKRKATKMRIKKQRRSSWNQSRS